VTSCTSTFIRGLHIVVSIDGLRPEHDARRSPATYERILKNIAGHRITVHCTITRPQIQRPGYLADFADFRSNCKQVDSIWFSLFTPQEGEQGPERLTARDRQMVVTDLAQLARNFRKLKCHRPFSTAMPTPQPRLRNVSSRRPRLAFPLTSPLASLLVSLADSRFARNVAARLRRTSCDRQASLGWTSSGREHL
jgi:hypothetical protein